VGAAPANVSVWNGPPGTLGELAAEVTNWMKGDLRNPQGQMIIRDAINDAISSIWMSAITVKLARFIGSNSPVQLSIASGTSRIQFTSIPNPVAALAIATQAGGNLPSRSVQAGFTYVTESGSETLVSTLATTVAAANTLTVITPPAFPGPPALPGCIGWNLYAGSTQNTIGLQNQQPLPFNANWIEPLTGIQDYPQAQQAPPTENSTCDNLAYIEHLEMQLPDGTYSALNQASLDSEIMRQLSRIVPNASQYQTFCWDIINGKTFEIRPQTGLAINAQYWYVIKPRRLRYDPAKIPYESIQGVHEFVRDFAVMKGKLSLEEYLAFQAWQSLVEAGRTNVISALNQENFNLDNIVRPYLYG
jgi:hypothetical protein